ncbi:glycosyltransferase family 2 protein [Candidatus Woesearchaeota archaeon]|nr:glycosyltransferase family 2 protein [Candidatus Woesearchaeota archaeon]
MNLKIAITIPAYNEEKTLPKVLAEIAGVMKKTQYTYSLFVVDDGSKDKTAQVARKAGAKVCSHRTNYGLARAFQTEIKQCLDAGADVIVHTDADGQYMARDIPLLIKEVEKGYDLVIGSRFAGRIEHMPFMKRLGNRAFARVFSKILGQKITDTTTGFRAFTRPVAEEIKFINTFTYTQEQLIKAAKQNFKIKEIPVNARRTRESRLFSNPFQYAWRAWINILRIYRDYDPLKFFGRIGGVFIIVAFLVGVYILWSWLSGRVDSVNDKIPSMILVAIFFITGIQTIIFGFLADQRR